MGVAAVCKNCRFQLTTVATRYGLQTVMQGPNQAAITGLASLIYTPENPGETLFQVPMVFDSNGFLLSNSQWAAVSWRGSRDRWSPNPPTHTLP